MAGCGHTGAGPRVARRRVAEPGGPDVNGDFGVTVVNTVRPETPVVPTGPLLLCACLEREGLPVRFLDYQAVEGVEPGDPAAFAEWLGDSSPVVGFSVLSSSLPLVLAAAPRLKAARPDRWLVLGGPGTTGVEASLLGRFPSLDIVVHGEGDESFPAAVDALRNRRPLADVPGLSFRDARGVHTTAPRSRIADLDRLPLPAYHLADLTPYLDGRSEDSTPFGVLFSRGCAFRCAFCTIPGTWHGTVHARGTESAVEELRQVRERFGVRSFRILDDTFTVDRSRAMRFCDRLTAANLGMSWLCHARVDCVDEPLIAALKGAGCELIFYGIESGSDNVLRRLGKTFGVARALDVIEMSRRHLKVETSFLWGFPFESLDDLYDTLVTLLAAHDMGARTKLTWFVPLPAAALTRECRGQLSHRTRDEVFSVQAHKDHYVYGPELMAVVRGNPDILSCFYYLDYPGHGQKMAYLERWVDGRESVGRAGEGGVSRVSGTVAVAAPEGRLPAPAPGVSLRTVGGRRFIFDADRLRSFRITAFADSVFRGCERGADTDRLVASLVARHVRSHAEVRQAVVRVLAQFESEGLLSGTCLPPHAPC